MLVKENRLPFPDCSTGLSIREDHDAFQILTQNAAARGIGAPRTKAATEAR